MAKPTSMVNQPYYPSTDYISGAQHGDYSDGSHSHGSAIAITTPRSCPTTTRSIPDTVPRSHATDVNNEAIMDQYTAESEYWMYDEAVKHGLYSQPRQEVAAAVRSSTGIQAGTAVIGAGATAYAGAAASAAGAAICWLARRCHTGEMGGVPALPLYARTGETAQALHLHRTAPVPRSDDAQATEIGELMILCLR